MERYLEAFGGKPPPARLLSMSFCWTAVSLGGLWACMQLEELGEGAVLSISLCTELRGPHSPI